MHIKLDCPNCGRSLTLPESEAGLPALCNACGHRLIIPLQIKGFDAAVASEADLSLPALDAPAATSSAAEASMVGGSVSDTSARVLRAAPGPSPANRWPKPRPRVRGFWGSLDESQWTALGVALACVILLIAVVIVVMPHGQSAATVTPADPSVSQITPSANSWEWRKAFQIRSLINDADTRIIAGDLAGASERYQQLRELLAGRTISDAGLRAECDRAMAQKQKVTAVLAARVLNAPVAPTTASAAAESRAVPPVAEASSKTWDPDTDPDLKGRILNGPLSTTRPATAPVIIARPRLEQEPPSARGGITDEQIGASIQKGANWVLLQFDSHENRLRGVHESGYPHDLAALCVYALLQCGQASSDPRLELHNDRGRIRPLLDALAASTLEPSAETYGRALRASALAFGDRPADRAALKKDFAWLVQSQKAGKYGYNASNSANGNWDNSNSQYGLLGVWAGAEVGLDAPSVYWQQVQRHWTETQNKDGTWGYHNEESGTQPMTLAGVASLFVAHDYLETPQAAEKVGRPPYTPPLARGLAWLEQGQNAITLDERWEGYSLYAVERVGLASGFKTFGNHDWYRELATKTVAGQGRDGSWENDLVHTAYALLFLSRGRHPILMNKLRFDGYWANRPRDLANLCRFASRELERPVNWQVVSAESDWPDWTDSPVLYLASHVDPKLPDAVVEKLRSYVEAGGLLFTQADGGQAEFDDYAHYMAHRLFPQFPMTDVPADHELYKVLYTIEPRPPLKMVSNGARVLMVHSPEDLSMAWQQRAEKGNPQAFRLGVNLFLYASGKHDLRNRLVSTYLQEMPTPHGETLRVSRVRYAGNWNPEPAAWTHFSRWFQGETGNGIEVTDVALASLAAKGAPFAHLTGAAAFDTSDAEVTALRQYVDGGGTVVIDACGGNVAFVESATKLLGRAFPDTSLRPIAAGSALLSPSPSGMDDLRGPPELRPFALTKLGKGASVCETLTRGKGRVLFTSLDVTSGLLGTRTWGILGYEPAYAMALMKNALLWPHS